MFCVVEIVRLGEPKASNLRFGRDIERFVRGALNTRYHLNRAIAQTNNIFRYYSIPKIVASLFNIFEVKWVPRPTIGSEKTRVKTTTVEDAPPPAHNIHDAGSRGLVPLSYLRPRVWWENTFVNVARLTGAIYANGSLVYIEDSTSFKQNSAKG